MTSDVVKRPQNVRTPLTPGLGASVSAGVPRLHLLRPLALEDDLEGAAARIGVVRRGAKRIDPRGPAVARVRTRARACEQCLDFGARCSVELATSIDPNGQVPTVVLARRSPLLALTSPTQHVGRAPKAVMARTAPSAVKSARAAASRRRARARIG